MKASDFAHAYHIPAVIALALSSRGQPAGQVDLIG
jgi:hypothetical protein